MQPRLSPSRLLVSVRDAIEAEAALRGGADVIDVKDPALGSLGRADAAVIAAIVAQVAGRAPVSAALGELLDDDGGIPAPPLAFVKWGLAGCANVPSWREKLHQHLRSLHAAQGVFVAYADWQCAQAPPLDDVFDLAAAQPGSVLLVDTHCKDASASSLGRRPTLLDWLPRAETIALCQRCRAANVRIALAGSLGFDDVAALLPARPDWFAVRGAACAASDRRAAVQAGRVAALKALIATAATPAG